MALEQLVSAGPRGVRGVPLERLVLGDQQPRVVELVY